MEDSLKTKHQSDKAPDAYTVGSDAANAAVPPVWIERRADANDSSKAGVPHPRAAQQEVSRASSASPHHSHYRLSHPTSARPRPWKNCLPRNRSLVPERLGTAALKQFRAMSPLPLGCLLLCFSFSSYLQSSANARCCAQSFTRISSLKPCI